MLKNKIHLSVTQIIAITILALILLGAFLLSTPLANENGEWRPFIDALFTSTSASCVTGLSITETGSSFTLFGELVILVLIQIGGLGFITFMTLFSVLVKRKISLSERKLIMQSAGSMQVGGTVKLVRKIIVGTLIFEGVGAVILALRFSLDFSLGKAIYFGIFHSVSAFCNAGFDVFGKGNSLADYSTDPTVMLTVCTLILIGGLGFLVWSDMAETKCRFSRYRLHTKIALVSSLILLLGSTLYFFWEEYDKAFAHLDTGEKLLAALFHAVTPRTAGFYITNYNGMSEGSYLVTVILMFIGGNPGSTAGGIKTVTLTALIVGTIGKIKHKDDPIIFKRRLASETVELASAVTVLYFLSAVTATLFLNELEPFTLKENLFEVTSAIGTVGLSLGITPQLTVISKLVLCLLMFMGRVGGLTFALAIGERKSTGVPTAERPTEKVIIG